VTRASIFAEAGKRTPVFVRFSTVAGERGSTDTARDVRGFAVKFYTDEGNWDLVGNNIPVFFIQDAMKFPDLVHAVKPEPHHGMPQAASAHDTFWDFVSLMPETTHMLMWVMSDRAIPRSYRMMQGFGVHTFRFVNEAGKSTFVKFHWNPLGGTHSLAWDEAVKISGADPDFHRRDLWEAIEAGAYPEWELGVQLFSEADAERYSFDVLDATKLIPEELVPVTPVGRMVLDRNPDNFFAETEQVAFCTAHIVPGLDFSNDPLLAGRIHSYVDTQISRLGGPNFHEIPINAPVAQVHNNQRDGMHRQAIARGRVAYEPNSLGGGCPFQAGMKGFTSFPQPVAEDKVRGKPEKFAEHYEQAALFFRSQSEVEQRHIVRVPLRALEGRDRRGARAHGRRAAQTSTPRSPKAWRAGSGCGAARSRCRDVGRPARKPEVAVSPALSLLARPAMSASGRGASRSWSPTASTVRRRNVVARRSRARAPSLATSRRGLGPSRARPAKPWPVDMSFEIAPPVLWDGVVVPGGRNPSPRCHATRGRRTSCASSIDTARPCCARRRRGSVRRRPTCRRRCRRRARSGCRGRELEGQGGCGRALRPRRWHAIATTSANPIRRPHEQGDAMTRRRSRRPMLAQRMLELAWCSPFVIAHACRERSHERTRMVVEKMAPGSRVVERASRTMAWPCNARSCAR
jgi:catalase